MASPWNILLVPHPDLRIQHGLVSLCPGGTQVVALAWPESSAAVRREREDSGNDCCLGCNAGLLSPIQAMSVTVECVCMHLSVYQGKC